MLKIFNVNVIILPEPNTLWQYQWSNMNMTKLPVPFLCWFYRNKDDVTFVAKHMRDLNPPTGDQSIPFTKDQKRGKSLHLMTSSWTNQSSDTIYPSNVIMWSISSESCLYICWNSIFLPFNKYSVKRSAAGVGSFLQEIL